MEQKALYFGENGIIKNAFHLKKLWIIFTISFKNRSNDYYVCSFSVLFKGKLSSELNLIFIKSFSYSPNLCLLF